MEAVDVAPSRYGAAISAAKTFVSDLPDQVRVGLISFDRSPEIVASPTVDHDAVLAAQDAAGIAPSPDGQEGAAVVLLSDGVTTVGSPVASAAQQAAERGIPVSTIAFGTGAGTVVVQGEVIPVPADPDTMAQVAELTSGRFFEAVSADELRSVYVAVQVRRRRDAAKFASPALLPLLVPRRPGWWRHLIAVVFAAGLVLATVGAAQPTIPGEVEREQATIIVAIDTSDSMGATDVEPNRITAAVNAARSFIGDLPSTFHVGLVTANSAPAVIVAPTTDHQAVQNALDSIELSPGTALGEAIFTSLAAVPRPAREAGGSSAEADEDKVPAAHIVLLSDGVTTTGR